MEKTQFTSAIDKFKKVGITSYGAFCRGGNYELRHNGIDTFIIPSTDFAIHLKYSDPYENLSRRSKFEIDMVPYDNIDYIFPIEIDYKEATGLFKALGAFNADIEKFFSNSVSRFDINTYSKKMAEGDFLDSEGNVTANQSGRSAYIVEAEADRRSATAIDKSNGKTSQTEEKVSNKWHTIVSEKKD